MNIGFGSDRTAIHSCAGRITIRSLRLDAMREASAALIGRRDFAAFASGEGQRRGMVRTVRRADWSRDGDLLRFEIEADAFLRGMVRAIVGTLLWVGRGKTSVERFGEIVRSQDRAQAGPSAPAQGLCLTRVTYDENETRAGRAEQETPKRGQHADDDDQQ